MLISGRVTQRCVLRSTALYVLYVWSWLLKASQKCVVICALWFSCFLRNFAYT
jgi:hypothetical protein